MKNHVFYHGNCYDGFGAAYAAWKKLGDTAEYHPVSYGGKIPDVDGDRLYIVDFSFKKDVLFELLHSRRFNHIIVLDHHKTAQEDLEPLIDQYSNLHIVFDMDRSGALITWDYFHKPEPAPMLIQYISDRDLWQFKLPATKKIHKALVSYPMDFKLWDSFDVNRLEIEGETCERLYTQLVANICSKSWKTRIDDHEVPVVNTSIAWSEVGAKLLDDHPDAPFVASFTVMKNGHIWSLRSREDFDVSAVAKKFGGGGHKQAAGFKTARW